ncbi:hypothetical protein [Microbispora sp. NPDC049125]|uniref:hypothetical protein n=1 Tax=Microbispora sp. NPDC049125 TaxID=3154929 RepID=UPI0034668267
MKRTVLAAAVFGAAVAAVAAPVAVAAGKAGDAGGGGNCGGGGRAFTCCMRAHGLPGFPDVTFSEDGLVNLDIRGERVDALSAKYGAAVKACQSLLPAGSRLPDAPTAPRAPAAPEPPS